MLHITIEQLNAGHEREGFDCAEESLNRYLLQYASQHQKKNIGRVYVASTQNESHVLGYYTLANGSVTFQSAPRSEGLSREYPIPVILIARLAIDISLQGKGLGATLIYDALKRVDEVAEIFAAYAVIVDALNEQAKSFYLHYRFEECLDDPMRLFLPMRDIHALLAKPALEKCRQGGTVKELKRTRTRPGPPIIGAVRYESF
ncbi:MAG: GNAT family N-acetyltransferase [Chloracidobacterium sp.]|nr:GNAT family N-acetyltransferase [Chloracidobacterium sp.]